MSKTIVYFIRSIDENNKDDKFYYMVILNELREQAPYIDLSIFDNKIKSPTLQKEYIVKLTEPIYEHYRLSISNMLSLLNIDNEVVTLVDITIKSSYISLLFV